MITEARRKELRKTHSRIMKQREELLYHPMRFKDAGIEEQLTRITYRAYCVDCMIHEEYPVPYRMYSEGRF